MDLDINRRVEALIDKTSNTKSAFAEKTGINTVILSHISSGRNKVSLTTVQQILLSYPNVNAEWLILGKGGMFKSSNKNESIQDIKNYLNVLKQGVDESSTQLHQKIKHMEKYMDKLI